MALGDRRFTRIPPESTGDRIYQVHTAEIEYQSKSAGHVWQIGQRYNVDGFGMVHVHGVYEDSSTTGILAVHYNKTAKFENLTPTAGEEIQLGGVNKAIVTSSYDLFIPTANIMGYDNPEYGLDVDITGSAKIRFNEGQPQLDAWGKLRVSGAQHLGDYTFGQQEKLDDNFATVGFDGGYVEWSNDRKSVRVGIDPTPTAPVTFSGSAAFAGTTSNTYHHYFPGSSHLYMATTALNSPATTGSTRRWGMFDASNGFFFILGTGGTGATDATGFCVALRSSATLAIADRGGKDLLIPRSEWNGDKLDGTGDSQEILDLSHDNIWWIDVQWHGAGRVRFGTYVDGQRVVCHSYYHGNRYEYAMTQTASLPICFSNKSSATTNNELWIETWSGSVWTETELDLRESGKGSTYASNHVSVTKNINEDWQYLFSLSPKELIDAGIVNHSLYMPTGISAYAFDNGWSASSASLDAIIDLKAEINSIHTGHSFSAIRGTGIEVSYTGSSFETGQVILQEMFKGRYENDLTDTYNNFQYGSVKNYSEDGGTKVNTISSITATSVAEIAVQDADLFVKLREPQGVTFPINASRYGGKVEISGSTNTNYNGTYYLKNTGVKTAELYTDEALTTPVNSSAFGAFTGTARLEGFYGSKVIWSFFAKTRTALHADTKLMLTINWKEIVQ